MKLLDRLALRFGPAPRPGVFVCGMPKSGTTAVLRLMGIASGESTSNDPFYELDVRGVVFRDAVYNGELDIGRLVKTYPAAFRGTLVKDPNFVFFRSRMTELYPEAAWVFTIRDPRDNIRSILNRLRLPGRDALLVQQMGNLRGAWRDVLEGRNPASGGRSPIEHMARRWLQMAERARDAGNGVVISRYEDFVRDKPGRIAELCRAVGLDPVHSIEADADREFQPRGDRKAVWSEFYGADELAAIESTCGPLLAHFGYSSPATAT
jgi:hypothetical protein